MQTERRTRRSDDSTQALQFLVEALASRSEVDAVALVDESATLVAGTGFRDKLAMLTELAEPMASGGASEAIEAATTGTEYFARKITLDGKVYFLAAIGTRLRRFP